MVGTRHTDRRQLMRGDQGEGFGIIVMKARLIAVGFLVLAGLVAPGTVQATHNATFCKWDFPWPRQIEYWIEEGSDSYNQFLPEEATRVSYGPATWSEGNFNLYFSRVPTLGQSEGGNTFIAMGVVSDPTHVAEAWPNPSPSCNRDAGNPINSAFIIFNRDAGFSLDCAAYKNCGQLKQIDLHDLSAHETGHWFFLADISWEGPTTATMFHHYQRYDETFRRDLDTHDKDAAWIMYGCRSGTPCH